MIISINDFIRGLSPENLKQKKNWENLITLSSPLMAMSCSQLLTSKQKLKNVTSFTRCDQTVSWQMIHLIQ